jgi:hypothetical protein
MENKIKIINNKTYYKEENNEWYGLDKNNKPRKVTNIPLLQKLNTEESIGLGDTIAKITKAIGIEPCESCNRRKQKLNTIFPWMKQDIRQLTEEELYLMQEINSSKIIHNQNIIALFKLYNNIFSLKIERCNCPGLIKRMVGRINQVIAIQQEK